MTTREWVIPPRPKPGRKPATDTPPTKRKAQNRAAQRAFRERRAARVNELEEQLEEQKEEHTKKETEYKERISHLEMEIQSHKSRCEVLQNLLDQERKDRVRAETELDSMRRRWESLSSSGQFPATSKTPTHPPSLANPSSVYRHSTGSHDHSPVGQVNIVENSASGDFTCGSCGPTGRCVCAETVIQSVEGDCGKCTSGNRCDCANGSLQSALPDLKRARPSPTLPTIEKRQRSDWNADDSAIEIDFTSYFKKTQLQSLKSQPQPPAPPSIHAGPVHDPCGFCKEGDYCVCAEAAPFSQQTQTPPPETDMVPSIPTPMEIDSNGAVKLRPRHAATASGPKPAASRSCGPGGPGTCAQCVADPVSGLFCRALSANINRQGSNTTGGCCGGGGAAGGCCKSGNPAAVKPKAEEPKTTGLGVSLSCAETYQTLSSHRNFREATDDIGSWLPKLRAAPTAGVTLPSPTASSRLPIEVEAASIMSVLKDFDIRFGRGL